MWSAKPRKLDFTVFTQLTVNRLSALLEMCGTFSGPLSAAVFQAVVQQPGGAGPGGDGELSKESAAVVAEGLAEVQKAFKRCAGQRRLGLTFTVCLGTSTTSTNECLSHCVVEVVRRLVGGLVGAPGSQHARGACEASSTSRGKGANG